MGSKAPLIIAIVGGGIGLLVVIVLIGVAIWYANSQNKESSGAPSGGSNDYPSNNSSPQPSAPSGADFTTDTNKAIRGYNVEVVPASSHEECANMCWDKSWCKSADSHNNTYLCHLSGENKNTKPDSYVDEKYSYHHMNR